MVRSSNGRYSLTVPVEDVPRVKKALDVEGVKYQLDEDAVREKSKPRLAVFDFDERADAVALQRIIEAA